MADLNKNQNFNLFGEESKELIHSMGNTEYFEVCEISSKVQCPDCSLHWEIGIVHCTCGKWLQPSERNRQLYKERYDLLSISNYAMRKNPSHGARHGPTEKAAHLVQSPQYTGDSKQKGARHHVGKIPKRFSLTRLIDSEADGMRTS